jgi:hypothetical protein
LLQPYRGVVDHATAVAMIPKKKKKIFSFFAFLRSVAYQMLFPNATFRCIAFFVVTSQAGCFQQPRSACKFASNFCIFPMLLFVDILFDFPSGKMGAVWHHSFAIAKLYSVSQTGFILDFVVQLRVLHRHRHEI